MHSSGLGHLSEIVFHFPKQCYPGQDRQKDFWSLVGVFDCPQQLVSSVALTNSKQTFCCWTLEIFLFCSIIEKGEENCRHLIEAHKECMRALGFKIWDEQDCECGEYSLQCPGISAGATGRPRVLLVMAEVSSLWEGRQNNPHWH